MNYEEHETSTPAYKKDLDNTETRRTTKDNIELLNQMWPTEKSTMYHLGGTRFWELDFEVTEPSDVLPTTAKSKTIHAITETTCLHIILENKRKSTVKSKRNVYNHKRDIHDNQTKKLSTQQDNSLKNVTEKSTLLYIASRKKQPDIRAKKLKSNLQESSNRYKQNFRRKQKAEFNAKVLRNEDSIIATSRKLCDVNKPKSKHHIDKHKSTINSDRNKKRQLGKSQKSKNINLYSLRNSTNSCTRSKKNLRFKYHKAVIMKTTEHHYPQIKNIHKNIVKMNPHITANHKNKSTSVSHERKLHGCLNCICDIASVIKSIRSILDRTSFLLEDIKGLNCTRYKEIQDNIVISMDSDVEEAKAFPQPRYNTESLKGQKYIKLGELEDDFKNDLELDNGTASYDIL